MRFFNLFPYILIINFLFSSCKKTPTQGFSETEKWTKRKEFAGGNRIFLTGFSLNGNGYVAMGLDNNLGNITFNDLWKYDPINNVWSEQASLPDGKERSRTASFVINGKAYIVAGHKTQTYFNDLWQYDSQNNVWTQKASLPVGLGRDGPVGFVLNNKGYITLGNGMLEFFTDLWQYDPANDTWTQKASLPANKKRFSATSFVLNGKAYVVGGMSTDGTTILGDVLEYDPGQNIWLEKNPLPQGAERSNAISFVLNNKAYIIGGSSHTWQGNFFSTYSKDDILEYDAVKDEWKISAILPADVKRYNATSFIINDRAYIVGGTHEGNFLSSMFQFVP
jgi:N-acetylneuraminic acid mutarotase